MQKLVLCKILVARRRHEEILCYEEAQALLEGRLLDIAVDSSPKISFTGNSKLSWCIKFTTLCDKKCKENEGLAYGELLGLQGDPIDT